MAMGVHIADAGMTGNRPVGIVGLISPVPGRNCCAEQSLEQCYGTLDRPLEV